MLEESTDHPRAAMHDGRMDRAEPGLVGAGVGALFEQELHEVFVLRVCRHGGSADAPGIRVVDVRSGGDKQLRGSQITDERGKHQRRVVPMRESLVVGQVTVRRNRFNIGPCGARA